VPVTALRTGWKDAANAVCMFAVGFLAVASFIHLGIRNPQYLHADIRSEKLALLRQWSGDAYSASFGSSHVHNGFDPRAFDRVMAGTPSQTHTLNLAIAGGSQTEQRMTALEFLHSMHAPQDNAGKGTARACFVLLELGAGANFTNDHLVHPRAINIYDWPAAKFVMTLAPPQMGSRQRFGRIGYALLAMGLHYSNVGMISSRIFPAPLDSQMMEQETIEDRRGLWILPQPPSILPAIRKAVAGAPKEAAVFPASLLPGNRNLVDELQDASPVHNLQFAYLVMPKIADLRQWTEYQDMIETAHGPVPIVNLANPVLYPQLYEPTLWLDDAHLNEAGAQMASTLIAENLQHWYAVHGEPGQCGR
jgi:hypothetical protein